MDKALHRLLAVGIAVVVLAGCGTPRRSIPVTADRPIPSEEVTFGERVFNRYCHACHPGGEGGLGPALNNKPLPSFAIRFQVRNGVGAMPSFPRRVINSRELDDLITYMKYLRRLPVKDAAVDIDE